MVKCLKVTKEFGSEVRKFLTENSWLGRSTRIGKTQRYLLFPLKDNADTKKILAKFKGTIESRNLQKVRKKGPLNLKEAMEGIVPKGKSEFLRRSFDIVGDIAVLEIPEELKDIEKSISWTVLRKFPNIKVVAKKSDKTSGIYRIRRIKVLRGEKRSYTIHKEFGLRMHVDLNRAYFSPRLGSERIRIAKQVCKNEDILVVFAGISPQALVIAKQNPSANVWAIEINPEAVELMKENIRINYLGNRVTPLKGDVRKVIPKLDKKFDRIIMILPHEDEKFLPLALTVAKRGAKIHMYAFSKESEFPQLKSRLEKEHNVKVNQIIKAGEYSPYVWRVCVEMTAWRKV